VPHSSYTGWEPPAEVDDDKPILASGDPVGYRVEGDEPTVTEAPQAADSGEWRDFAEMFVNVGKRESVRTEDFHQLLGEAGIEAADVGRIRVRDRMTFVSVRKDALERAITALSGKVIGGRTVVAELAKGGGSGGRARAH